MHDILHNWRTSALGVSAILTAIGALLSAVGTNHWDADTMGAIASGLFTGIGLLFARDGRASKHEHEEDREHVKRVEEHVERVEEHIEQAVEHKEEGH